MYVKVLLTYAMLPAALSAADSVMKKPAVDMVAQKRVQYGRVLYPPQEKGFDPSAWIAKIESPGMMRGEFAVIEDLFDVRSRVYSVAERLRYRPRQDDDAASLVACAYNALNKMDLPAATNAYALLESRIGGSEAWMPYCGFCPFNWVKCFTQWGYMRAIDGCSVSEPNPWLVQWQDGFRLNLAQDPRVAIANTKGAPKFYETRYLKPMVDVKFERSWVDTRWIFPDKTITFSLLTPVIDVNGVDRVSISGLPSEPVRLRWTLPNGQPTSVQLTEAPPVKPEVIASAIMDFSAPPPQKTGWSKGVQKIDPGCVDRPYLRLVGRDWTIALFPGSRPVSAEWNNGVFTLKLRSKSWIGLMRLPTAVDGSEQPAVCELFASSVLAYPDKCVSSASDGRMTWRYSYRRRTSDWHIAPQTLAPVPPILDLAGISVQGAIATAYPTKWGQFRCIEGESVECALPPLPREPPLRGVNVGIWEPDSLWEAHKTNGAHWVRAVFNGNHSLEEHLTQLEKRIVAYGSRMRFLVDPHCKFYRVDWKTGIPAGKDGEFLDMWSRIASMCARHPEAIEGYDLYNEPGIVAGAEAKWRELCGKAATAIRALHPGAKVYYPAIYGGNPNGLSSLEPLPAECEPQTISFHFYSPHAFTHQKTATHNVGGDTCVFYPAWSAPIDWKAGNHFGGTTVDWYDKWALGAILLPAFEHYARHRKPMHVGEYSFVGYANQRSRGSAFLWTRDATELIEALGASWHLWNLGFGLGNPFVREYIYGLWGKSSLNASNLR